MEGGGGGTNLPSIWSMSKAQQQKNSVKGQLPTLALPRGTQRLFSVKYMFGEANIA